MLFLQLGFIYYYGITTSLDIVATVDVAGSFTNSAEITAVDQTDPDSTPGNNILAECNVKLFKKTS